MLDIGAIPPDAGQNRLARGGMFGHLTRQRQKFEGQFDINIRRRSALGQTLPFGLFAFAQLHIRPEPAAAERNFFVRHRIFAEYTRTIQRTAFARFRGFALGCAQLLGVAAFGIIRAANKCTKLAKLQRGATGAAGRASARIRAIRPSRENMRAHRVIERIDNLGAVELGCAFNGCGKFLPESAQHFFPADFGIGDFIEVFFQGGGEIIFDIF